MDSNLSATTTLMWLLSWLTTQETEFHDHGGSAAAFTVVQGALSESRIGSYGAVDLSHVESSSRSVQWVAPGVIHDVSNPFPQPAVSIHAYSPPLSTMTYYQRTPTGPKPIRTEPVNGPSADRCRQLMRSSSPLGRGWNDLLPIRWLKSSRMERWSLTFGRSSNDASPGNPWLDRWSAMSWSGVSIRRVIPGLPPLPHITSA